MIKLKEEKELVDFIRKDIRITPAMEKKLRNGITALIHAVENRCAETIRECKGIPFNRIDTGGRKWIYAPSDLVADAIQPKRRK